MSNKSKVAEEAIGLGALAQLSRNKKINGLGEIGILAGLIILIGELVKFVFKWCLIKPVIFFFKIIYKVAKYALIYGGALFVTLGQFVYKKYEEKKHI